MRDVPPRPKRAPRPDHPAAAPPEEPKPIEVLDASAASDLPQFMIVGIGASAGGLEACTELLRELPANLGMAYILVQHLSPQHESFLPDLLAGATRMPVVQVTDGMQIEPDHVYVIPPNAHMSIENGRLHLMPRPEGRTQHMPIDSFLRSLANYAQSRAIGVILSGTASDGAIGMREVKGADGITIVQDPRTAKNDGMPRAAIGTGSIDLILSPVEIAHELQRISAHPLMRPEYRPAEEQSAAAGADQLGRVFAALRAATGVDFNNYKQPTIRRRLARRMVLHKVENLEDYVKLLQRNPAEVHALYQDILIHVTRFFREPESFDVLTKEVFPALLANRGPDSPIRVWVPGCSTGEEAYSVAIALHEFLGDRATATPVQVFATDVSETAVEQARGGVYPESIAADVSPERLRRFFSRVDGSYRIAKSIRDSCIFARQDLTRDPPFSKLDLILCRNVLIYLGPQTQKRLMALFHYALRPMGYLMLGAAETVGAAADLFSVVDKRHKLYARKSGSDRTDMDFPVGDLRQHRPMDIKPPADEPHRTTLQRETNNLILSRYTPPGVVVDADLQIVQFRGQTGKFLEPSPGDPSLSLLKMAREGLLYAIRSAVQDASKSGDAVRREGLRVRANGGTIDVALEVVPLRISGSDEFFLIVFEEHNKGGDGHSQPAAGRKGKAKGGRRPAADRRVIDLERELAASREYLQSIIQDLEAANEELQSANEEILSANEELQSTNEELDTAKEELQSTNEELHTVNEELQGRNEELSRVNGDLVNLLANVQIAIVIVAGDLRIRRFTPMAEKVLNLIPTDIGRPISDIKPNIDCPDLEAMIAESIDSVAPKERDVQDRSGRWYSLRVRPYKSVENRIDGAVLALFERQEPHLQAARDESELARRSVQAIVRGAGEPLALLDAERRVHAASPAFWRLADTTDEHGCGRSLYELNGGRWNTPDLRVAIDQVLAGQPDVADLHLALEFPALGRRTFAVNIRSIRDRDDRTALLVLALHDRTD